MASSDDSLAEKSDASEHRTVGAFDIRFIIAALLGIYAVVCLLLGIFDASAAELKRGDGLNVNLWAGLGIAATSIFFFVWGRLRPTIVPDDFEEEE